MTMGADLTDDELAGLEITDSCGCSICRLGREVQRRRAAHAKMRSQIESLGIDARAGRQPSMARHSAHELVVAFEFAEGK